MISSQYQSPAFQDGDPARYLDCLGTLVNYYQVEYGVFELSWKNLIGGTCVGAANDIAIVENLLDSHLGLHSYFVSLFDHLGF